MTSSKRMLSVTNTMYIAMYKRPRNLPSFHLNNATLMTITSSMTISSSTEQNSPLLMTATAWPLFAILNRSHGMGRLHTKEQKIENRSYTGYRQNTIQLQRASLQMSKVNWQCRRGQCMVFTPFRAFQTLFSTLAQPTVWFLSLQLLRKTYIHECTFTQ